MYTPSHFDETRTPVLYSLIEECPLAAVVAATANGIQANHVPLILEPSDSGLGTLRGHIARANSMRKDVQSGAEVLALF